MKMMKITLNVIMTLSFLTSSHKAARDLDIVLVLKPRGDFALEAEGAYELKFISNYGRDDLKKVSTYVSQKACESGIINIW